MNCNKLLELVTVDLRSNCHGYKIREKKETELCNIPTPELPLTIHFWNIKLFLVADFQIFSIEREYTYGFPFFLSLKFM